MSNIDKKKELKEKVREAYSKIAQGEGGCGCGITETGTNEFAKSIGYIEEELRVIPDEANMALICMTIEYYILHIW